MKRLSTCSFCGTATGPAFSFHLTRSLPPSSPSQEGLPAGTAGLILPWSALQLYPSDKALCVPSLSRFCLTLTIELRSFCYLWFGVSESAVAYLGKSWDTCALLIQFPHGWWPTRPDGCAIGGERKINDTKMFQPKVHPLYLCTVFTKVRKHAPQPSAPPLFKLCLTPLWQFSPL